MNVEQMIEILGNYHHQFGDKHHGGIVSIDDIINALKTNDKPKPGKWIDISDGVFDAVKCNQCGKIKDDSSNFCPNCGADMRGEQG